MSRPRDAAALWVAGLDLGDSLLKLGAIGQHR